MHVRRRSPGSGHSMMSWRCKPSGWTVLGFRERTMVTRFGDVVVSRRMYRDSDGGTVFALDECLGWRPRQLASPSMTERVVEMATEMSCRKVSDTVSVIGTAGPDLYGAKTPHRVGRRVMAAAHMLHYGSGA